jgi:hypothetical protein
MGQHTAESGRDPLQIACQYLVQVTEQMKAIGDLSGFRRTLGSTSGIVLGPVASNNFDPGMGA